MICIIKKWECLAAFCKNFFIFVVGDRLVRELGIEAQFVQENHSRSAAGTLRGLHYQLLHPQGKLLRVVRGALFDVVVDLRASSPTFGRSASIRLYERHKQSLWVPPGFAHGFLALEEDTQVIYAVTDYWYPEDERVLRWDDPLLGIQWPLPVDVALTLSERDRTGIALKDADTYP